MIERRGRPKETAIEPTIRQFNRVYEDDDMIETWTYDLDKHKGPILVDIKYKNGLDKKWGKIQKEQKRTASDMRRIDKLQENKNQQLPLSQQQWLNPANGKKVGYTRAKALNLIK